MNIAIITGASSGLGREYVRAVAEKMPELDEIWLIARRQQRLIDLAHTLPGHRFRILPYDLTTASSFRKLRGLLARENPHVWLLINDAGAMHTGPVAAMSLVNQEELITLHAVAPTRLVHLALPYMDGPWVSHYQRDFHRRFCTGAKYDRVQRQQGLSDFLH